MTNKLNINPTTGVVSGDFVNIANNKHFNVTKFLLNLILKYTKKVAHL